MLLEMLDGCHLDTLELSTILYRVMLRHQQ